MKPAAMPVLCYHATMNAPKHIGFIMDGNRRWARAQGLPTFEGHRRGKDKVREVVSWCIDAGVLHMTLYAFSTENWKRATDEVSYLMALLGTFLEQDVRELHEAGVRLRVIGERPRLSAKLQKLVGDAEEKTAGNTTLTLQVAISYGSRAEILDAIARAEKKDLTEDDFSALLWTAGTPDPDMIVRTSGEHRLSNFLLWQAAYAELFFPTVHWPAFSRADFDSLLAEYKNRQRRFGE
jgi:undecaprenyl diphosphate synthase